MRLAVKKNNEKRVVTVIGVTKNCHYILYSNPDNDFRNELISLFDFLDKYEILGIIREMKEDDVNKLKSGKQ